MPRKLRIHLPDVPQHLIQRGVDRMPTFFADDDCLFYLALLQEYSVKHHIQLHAYCLMTNHVHLLLSSPNATAVGKLMQDIGRRYVQYINKTYKRCGTLWQGRYKASFVQSQTYLLTCMRYIELNPVKGVRPLYSKRGQTPYCSNNGKKHTRVKHDRITALQLLHRETNS